MLNILENGIQLKGEEYTTVSSSVGMIPDGYPGSLWDVPYLKDEEKKKNGLPKSLLVATISG